MISPKVPVCQTLKEKIKSAMEWSSWRVSKRFRDVVLDRPKVIELEDAEDQGKKAMELTKGRIAEWISNPDLLRRLVLRNIFLLLGSQVDQVLSHLYEEPEEGLPYENEANPTNGT
uniref:Uncharacterized protein n=1 Tax=Solanum tuberosum TaxID=4113 RepID=M1DT26_SOLTU